MLSCGSSPWSWWPRAAWRSVAARSQDARGGALRLAGSLRCSLLLPCRPPHVRQNNTTRVNLPNRRRGDSMQCKSDNQTHPALARLRQHGQPNNHGLAWWEQAKANQAPILARLGLRQETKQTLHVIAMVISSFKLSTLVSHIIH